MRRCCCLTAPPAKTTCQHRRAAAERAWHGRARTPSRRHSKTPAHPAIRRPSPGSRRAARGWGRCRRRKSPARRRRRTSQWPSRTPGHGSKLGQHGHCSWVLQQHHAQLHSITSYQLAGRPELKPERDGWLALEQPAGHSFRGTVGEHWSFSECRRPHTDCSFRRKPGRVAERAGVGVADPEGSSRERKQRKRMPREGGAVAGANALASCLAYSCCSISMVRPARRCPPAARSALTPLPAGRRCWRTKPCCPR